MTTKTLPPLIASQKVLTGNGFTLADSRDDPELGTILRYRLARG